MARILILAMFAIMVFSSARAQEHEADPCAPEERDYDAHHRELLGMPAPDPGECVQALPGYPTRAAGWLAAVEAKAKKPH